MSSINKHSLVGWILGVALVATSGIALAGNVTGIFTTGETLTAAKMTEIQNAINDNDARVDGMQTGVPVCLGSMTRVGPTCVDTVRQTAGTTWSAAIDFCRNAGKRLLTPGEYVAARNLGTITDMTVYEWVDITAHGGTTPFTMIVGALGPDPLDSTRIQSFVNFTFDNRTGDDISNIFFRCAR